MNKSKFIFLLSLICNIVNASDSELACSADQVAIKDSIADQAQEIPRNILDKLSGWYDIEQHKADPRNANVKRAQLAVSLLHNIFHELNLRSDLVDPVVDLLLDKHIRILIAAARAITHTEWRMPVGKDQITKVFGYLKSINKHVKDFNTVYVKCLDDKFSKGSRLIDACQICDQDSAESLIAQGAFLDWHPTRNTTPLITVIDGPFDHDPRRAAIVKALLMAGADPDTTDIPAFVRIVQFTKKCENRRSREHQSEIIKLLVDAWANPFLGKEDFSAYGSPVILLQSPYSSDGLNSSSQQLVIESIKKWGGRLPVNDSCTLL